MMMMGGRPGQGGPGRGGPGIQMQGEKARNFKATMRQLMTYIGAYKFQIGLVLIFAIASTIFTIVGPKILGQATTKLFEGVMSQMSGAEGGIDFTYIGNIV